MLYHGSWISGSVSFLLLSTTIAFACMNYYDAVDFALIELISCTVVKNISRMFGS